MLASYLTLVKAQVESANVELSCCLTVSTVDVGICRLEYRPVLRFAHRFVLIPILPLTFTAAVKLVADRTCFTGVITAHTAGASDWK